MLQVKNVTILHQKDYREILKDFSFVLNPGDSIYFNATQPHCMRALDNAPVKFLAIIF